MLIVGTPIAGQGYTSERGAGAREGPGSGMGRNSKLLEDLRANAVGAVGLAAFIRHLLFNTGFQTVILYRLANRMTARGMLGRLAAKILQKMASDMSSCHISQAAEIGPGLRLPHATGVVIGMGSRLGKGVTIYQNVTIGAKEGEVTAYPVIGNDVTIYAGAVIVGAIRIGDGAIVGANSVVLQDVASGCVVVGAPARPVSRGLST